MTFPTPTYTPDLSTTVGRLRHLREVLRAAHARNERLNMRWWASGTKGSICGTTCCALGYAALDPEFKRLGLELVVLPYLQKSLIPFEALPDGLEIDGAEVRLNGGFVSSDRGISAGAKVLGVDLFDANWLFCGCSTKRHHGIYRGNTFPSLIRAVSRLINVYGLREQETLTKAK